MMWDYWSSMGFIFVAFILLPIIAGTIIEIGCSATAKERARDKAYRETRDAILIDIAKERGLKIE